MADNCLLKYVNDSFFGIACRQISQYLVPSHSSQLNIFQVEKSLQRINRGYKNAMYTSQKSIENKVGSVAGWKDLLMSVGFRFEPAANGIPSAVFFPRLTLGND